MCLVGSPVTGQILHRHSPRRGARIRGRGRQRFPTPEVPRRVR